MPNNVEDLVKYFQYQTCNIYMLESILIMREIFTTRARDYSPEIGRFYSMDELKGIQQAPLTLN